MHFFVEFGGKFYRWERGKARRHHCQCRAKSTEKEEAHWRRELRPDWPCSREGRDVPHAAIDWGTELPSAGPTAVGAVKAAIAYL